MRNRIFQRLQRAARLCNPFESRALILMYHRVVALPSDPQLLAVTPQHFAEHLQILRKHACPLRLTELARRLRNGKLPRRAVVITFDDGYADNLYNAKPLLEQSEIPATVFVTTGQIGQARESWWDELDRLLLQPGTLPPRLELSLNGRTWQWQLGESATYTNVDYERHDDWHIEKTDDPTPRQRLYRSLYQLLHSLGDRERQQQLGQVRTWASAEPIGRPTHRTLSEGEVIRLAAGDLVEIGAHTASHPVLASLSVTLQRFEIECSKAKLEEILNRPLTSFAYPHGSYSQETLAVVREAGFTCACSSDTAIVRQGADTFRLPRAAVRDWDGKTFARWLRGWYGGWV